MSKRLFEVYDKSGRVSWTIDLDQVSAIGKVDGASNLRFVVIVGGTPIEVSEGQITREEFLALLQGKGVKLVEREISDKGKGGTNRGYQG